jgi:3-hydroxybutyryl-CoA dehydrogenase
VSGRAAPPATIGVAGAGTMGAGIAQLAALAGARTLVHDPAPGTAERAREAIRIELARGAERGRIDAGLARTAAGRVEVAAAEADLEPCGLVIEAAPEALDLKRALFARLSGIVAADAVLATNTSSLPVTAVASGAADASRVVGMHFFNPAPRMPLVEVVAGEESSDDAMAVARATGEAMGKRVIVVGDGPGFVVNRCARPFGLEALRLVGEGVATHAQVDRICRLGAGFPMGPFELMDLVGVDVALAVALSLYEQSFGEPRWRPSPLAARMAAAGRHGRKTGRGWYDYSRGAHRPDDPDPPPGGGGDGLVVVAGTSAVALELAEAALDAGWEVAAPEDAGGDVPALILDCGSDPEGPPLQGGPQAVLCSEASLAELVPEGTAVGFHALPPLAACRLVELTRSPTTSRASARAAERFFASLGRHVEWVGDAPGLVLGRIVSQLVNEAAFALGEGVASAADIDAGLELGLNHPRGALAWGDVLGLDHVLGALDGLFAEYREERYRAAPLLRRLTRRGRLGWATGEGFHRYAG